MSDTKARRLYFGTYTGDTGSEGIYVLELAGFPPAVGPELLARADNPSFLARHPKLPVLYAVTEAGSFGGQPGGGVQAWRLAEGGSAERLGGQPTGAAGPCHLEVHPEGRLLVTANYGGGSVSVFPLQPDGAIGDRLQLLQHRGTGPNPKRQEAPHAHGVTFSPEGDRLLVPDLGIDKVVVYAIDQQTGILTESGAYRAAAGSGPRHITFTPDGRNAYLINELANTVTVLTWDADTGVLRDLQTLSTLPGEFDGTNLTAEILVDPTGRWVVGTNRGHDSLAVFCRDAGSGRLAAPKLVDCGGPGPRHATFLPDGRALVVGHQQGNTLQAFRFDPETGDLTPENGPIKVPAPVCLLCAG